MAIATHQQQRCWCLLTALIVEVSVLTRTSEVTSGCCCTIQGTFKLLKRLMQHSRRLHVDDMEDGHFLTLRLRGCKYLPYKLVPVLPYAAAPSCDAAAHVISRTSRRGRRAIRLCVLQPEYAALLGAWPCCISVNAVNGRTTGTCPVMRNQIDCYKIIRAHRR